MPEEQSGRREFERFTIEFEIEVSLLNDDTHTSSETAVLNDVSGGGVCFSTTRPELYSVGDRLAVAIKLPGTDTVNAKMTGLGTIAWIGSEGSSTRRARVGIVTDAPLSFDRIMRDAKHEKP
ncbi:MAG: PilZ domain-containing protein [Mariprofundaceae bacterium]